MGTTGIARRKALYVSDARSGSRAGGSGPRGFVPALLIAALCTKSSLRGIVALRRIVGWAVVELLLQLLKPLLHLLHLLK